MAEFDFAQDWPNLCLEDVRVQAFSPPLIGGPHAFRGGPVLDRDAHRIFRHDRHGQPADSSRPDEAYPDTLAGAYVYAGALYDHFGHFMAEMAHRIVPAQLLRLPARYLFVTMQCESAPTGFEALPGFVRDVLGFCGVSGDQVVVIGRNTIVERLHLVRQGAALGIYPRPGYLDALAAYSGRRLDRLHAGVARPEKLYVSRSGLRNKAGSFLGEAFVEARLERAGYHVFHPERYGFTEQMDHYRKARLVVFPGGSACHGTELLGTRMLGDVLLLPRTDGQSEFFRRVLKPRAVRFHEADASHYLGSLLQDRASGSESEHRGVSLLDLDRLVAAGARLDLAFPARFPRGGYAAAATRDLLVYGQGVGRRTPDRGGTGKLVLLARLLRRLSAMGRHRANRPASEAATVPRILGDREVAEIWTAAASLPTPFDAFYRIAMLTLQQQPHVAGMRWSELAADRRSWDIPAERTRLGRSHRVSLSGPVRVVLAGLAHSDGTDRVFQVKGKPLNGIARAKQALDEAITAARQASGGEAEALVAWSLFDLRRTGLLRLEAMGYEEAVIRSALALDTGPNEPPPPGAPAGTEAERARLLEAWAREVVGREEAPKRGRPDAVGPGGGQSMKSPLSSGMLP